MLIISSSLNPKSKSFLLALEAKIIFAAANISFDFLDLRDYDLPLCDGGECYGKPSVSLLQEKISSSTSIVCCSPVYNYDVNAALKTLLECTGKAWQGKVVSLMLTAGGFGSYMSPMSFLNSLMLDFRCLIMPDFVYTTEADFKDGKIINQNISERMAKLLHRQDKLASFYEDLS